MARRRARETNIFNFSFLDILACTIGALIFILVMVIINNSGMLDASALEEASQQLAKRRADLEDEIKKAKDELRIERVLTRKAEARVKQNKQKQQTPAPPVVDLDKIRKEIAKLEAEKRKQNEVLSKLRGELKQAESEVKRLAREKDAREAEARQDPGPPKIKPIPRRKQGVNREPIHVACHRSKLVIYPEKASVSLRAMSSPASAFSQAIKRIQRNPEGMCMVFWVYPDGVKTFKAARASAEEAGIGVGWEPALPGWELDL